MSNEMPLSEWSKIPFQGQDEVLAAMSSERYRSMYGEAYRAAVAAKLAISEVGLDKNYSGRVENSVTIGTDSLYGAAPAEDQKAVERAFAALRPDAPLAVDPNRIA